LIPTLTAGTTTGTAGIFTSGTIATLNSTTGTITNLSTTLAGDFTISQGTGTLGTTAVTAGSYGSLSEIPFITVDTKGRVTSATTGTFSTIPADNSITFAKFVSTDWTASLGTGNATSGFQKLPSGLIVQWGSASANTSGVTVTFSTAFPSYAYAVVATNNNQTNPPAPSLSSLSTTGFVATVSAGGPNFYYIALGL
jgi:hypothetical protein